MTARPDPRTDVRAPEPHTPPSPPAADALVLAPPRLRRSPGRGFRPHIFSHAPRLERPLGAVGAGAAALPPPQIRPLPRAEEPKRLHDDALVARRGVAGDGPPQRERG